MKSQTKNRIIAFAIAIITVVAFAIGCSFLSRADIVSASYIDIPAKAMCVMEKTSKRMIYHKNENAKMPMASTTKIMTAITAIENCHNLDAEFEISPKAIGIPGTSVYLRKGEVFTIRKLLYGLMLVSGNDASVAIGEQISGSVEKFVALMNETAKKIGANSSHFDNTHGLDSETHYTTAYDLALITSYAMENSVFSEIVSTKNTKIVNKEGKTRYLKNKNRLLNSLDGCNGVKTGFTNDAGRCLVSSAERNGMTLVCVVLNCGPMFEESSALLERGFSEYSLIDLTAFYSFPTEISVIGGKKDRVKVYTKGSCLYPLKDSELKGIECKHLLTKEVNSPLPKDSQVGEVEIYLDNKLHFSEKIYTMEEVRSKTIFEKIADFFKK